MQSGALIAHPGIKNIWPIIFGPSVIGALMMFFLFVSEKARLRKNLESSDYKV
jgi:hypothetical protein